MAKSPTSTKRKSLPSTSNDGPPPPPPPKLASTAPKIATSSPKQRSTFFKKAKSSSSQPPSEPSLSSKPVAVSASSSPPPPPSSSLPPSDTSSSPLTSKPSLFSSYSFAFPTSTSSSSGSISLLDQLGDAGQLFRRPSGSAESREGEIRKQEKNKTGGKDTKGTRTGTEREVAVLKERSAKALKEKALLAKPKRERAPSAAPPPTSPSTTTSKPPPSSAKPSPPKASTSRPRTEVPALSSSGSSPKKDPRRGKQQSTNVAVPLLQPSPPPQPSLAATSSTLPPLAPSAPSPLLASSSSPPSSPSSESVPTRPTTPELPALVPVSKSIYLIADDLRRKDKESKEHAEAEAAELALRRARANQPPPPPPPLAGPSTQIRASPPSPSTTTSKPAALGPTNGGSSSSVSSVASSTTPLTPSAPPRHFTSHPPIPLVASNHPSLFSGFKPPIPIMSANAYHPQQPPNRANLIPPSGQFNESSTSNRTYFQTGGPIPYSLGSMDLKGKGRELPLGPPNGYPPSQQQFQHPQGGPPRFQQQQQPGRDSFSSDQRSRPPPPPPPQIYGSRPEPRPSDNFPRLGPAQPYGQDPRRDFDGRNQQQQYQNRPPPFYSDAQPSLPPASSMRFQPQPVLPPGRFPPSSSASIPPFASSSRPFPPSNSTRPSISPITSSIPLPLPPLHPLPPRPSDTFNQSQSRPRPELERRRSAPVDTSRPPSPPSNPLEIPIETNGHDGSPPPTNLIPSPTPPPRSFPPTFLAPSNLLPGTRATDFVLQEKPSGTTLHPRNSRSGGGPSSPIAHHHARTTDDLHHRRAREDPRWIPPLHNRSGPTADALDEELGRMGIGRLTSRKTNFTAECYVHVESSSPTTSTSTTTSATTTTSHPLNSPISPSDLQTVCEIRFGPIASLTLVLPHKTRAFLTFASVGSALRAMLVSLPPEDGGEGGAGFGDQKRFVFEPRKRMLVDLYRDRGVGDGDKFGGVGGMREREVERLRMVREEEEREGRGEVDGGRGLWMRRREEEERRRVEEGEREKEEERRRWEELVSEQEEGTGGIGWREERERERDERLVGGKEDLECPICLQLLANPHILACCGHTLCLRCIEQVLQSPPRTCPCCREPIGKPIPNRLAATAVESFVQRSLIAFDREG